MLDPLVPIIGMSTVIFFGIILLAEIVYPKFKKSFFNLVSIATMSVLVTLFLVVMSKTLD